MKNKCFAEPTNIEWIMIEILMWFDVIIQNLSNATQINKPLLIPFYDNDKRITLRGRR